MFTSMMFASILPEILILISPCILALVVEPFWKEEQRRNVGWLTAGGLFAIHDHQPALRSAWRTDFRLRRHDPF